MNTQTDQRGNVATLPPPNPTLPATIDPKHIVRAPEGPPPTIYPKTLAEAILKITRAVGPVKKAGFNQHHNYNFQSWEDVLATLGPLEAENGIIIQQSQVATSLFDNDSLMAITYEFTIIHESGEVWPDRPVWTGVSRLKDSKGVYDDKCANKCHTAAHKYFCLHFFKIRTKDMVTADADADGNGSKQSERPPNPNAPRMRRVRGDNATDYSHDLLELICEAKTVAAVDVVLQQEKIGIEKLQVDFEDIYSEVWPEIQRHRASLVEALQPTPQAEAQPEKPAPKAVTPPPNPFAAKPKPGPATEAKPDLSQGDGLDIPEIFRRHRPEVEAILAKLKATTTVAATEQFLKDQHDAIVACSLQETKDIQTAFMDHRAALVAKQDK